MRTVELIAEVDERRHLHAEVPPPCAPGLARVLVFVPDDEAAVDWIQGVAREWHAEPSGPREDLYTLADGRPVHVAR